MREIPTTVKNKALVKKRRQQIIMAGIKLFSKNGYHKTTLKELAEEAGLSHGNIYDYVGSKEDIFFLIHDFLASSAMEILNNSLENIQDPIDKLRRMVRGEFNLMDQWADTLLLIYQESHILKGDFLRRLLEKERAHLEKFEIVINECIAKGQFKNCNVRLLANLIKSMIDSWTIKRWDLRGHANQLDAEGLILELVFNGLLAGEQDLPELPIPSDSHIGKTVLLVNGGTVLGQAICSMFLAQGLKLIVHVDSRNPSKNRENQSTCLPTCTIEQQEPLTSDQIQAIEKEYGPIDIYVHDLGIGTTEYPLEKLSMRTYDLFEENLRCAHELATYFKTQMAQHRSGRIIYLAPWSWDRHTNLIRYETAKAGAIALCKAMSRSMAANGINVNCIVPGYIRSDRPQNIEKELNNLDEKIPAGRLGEVFDITAAILFLIGDGAKYITGQVLNVTGG